MQSCESFARPALDQLIIEAKIRRQWRYEKKVNENLSKDKRNFTTFSNLYKFMNPLALDSTRKLDKVHFWKRTELLLEGCISC